MQVFVCKLFPKELIDFAEEGITAVDNVRGCSGKSETSFLAHAFIPFFNV